MKINVIICTYNRAEMLRDAIQSILEAEVPSDTSLQLIIVNNNSTDNTKGIIKGFFNNDLGVQIKYSYEEKQGKSHALNTALKHITGDLIAFLDDDQTVDKGWLREMANALKKYPDYKCFGSKVIAVYPCKIPKWIDINGSMIFLKSVFCHKDEGDEDIEYGDGTISKTPGGGNMFFRRQAIEQNAFFRTDLGPVGRELGFSEDTDFCHRLLEKGERFMYVSSVIVYHPVHPDRLKKEYLLKWQYRVGRSEVRRNGEYKNTAKVIGVPRYLYRKMIEHSIGWSLSIQSKKRFYHRLRLYYTVGQITEHLRVRFKKL